MSKSTNHKYSGSLQLENNPALDELIISIWSVLGEQEIVSGRNSNSSWYKVSGSDEQLGETTLRLTNLGASIFEGHHADHILGADVVVYTSAIQAHKNEETKAAIEKRIPTIKRTEMLAEHMRMKYGIGIAGTHGKTTTTTMTGLVIQEGNFDPNLIIVGGKVHVLTKPML